MGNKKECHAPYCIGLSNPINFECTEWSRRTAQNGEAIMEKDTHVKGPAPPYVPYRTLQTFLDRFKQGVPNRIGTDLMRSMSGGVRGQLLTSLKSFRLISETGTPTDLMKRLCVAEGAERQNTLKELIEVCYPYLFHDGFQFSTTTMSLLREAIQEHTVANGETVSRCIAFLKDAATDAAIQVSPFLQEAAKARAANRNGTRRTPSGQRRPEQQQPQENTHASDPPRPTRRPIEAEQSLLLWGLFQRLPKPGTPWSKIDRDQWTKTLENVLSLEYPTE